MTETLHGFVLTETTATITVTSTGCTDKKDFKVQLQKSSPPIATFIRVNPDLCEAAPHSVDIVFSLEEIGASCFKVGNLFEPGPSRLPEKMGTVKMPENQVELTGKLVPLAGIGGESTGFGLSSIIELDLKTNNLDDQFSKDAIVSVIGEFQIFRGVESGERHVLVVSKIEKLS